MKPIRSASVILISFVAASFALADCTTAPQPPKDVYGLIRDLGQLGNLTDYRRISALLEAPINPTFSDYSLLVEYIVEKDSSALPGLHIDRYTVAYPGSIADGQSAQPHGSLILRIGAVEGCVSLPAMKKKFGDKPDTIPLVDVSGPLYGWRIPSRGSRSLRVKAFFGPSSQDCAYNITLSQ